MDETYFLQIFREEGSTEEIRAAYANWLEGQGDQFRADYIQLEHKRQQVQNELTEIENNLNRLGFQIDPTWADVVFPLTITSPCVGRFYGAPSPDDPPFVKVGDYIQTDTTVCIIEALRIFNPIPAGVSGIIVEVLVSNAKPVEFDQPLFRVERRRNLPFGG